MLGAQAEIFHVVRLARVVRVEMAPEAREDT